MGRSAHCEGAIGVSVRSVRGAWCSRRRLIRAPRERGTEGSKGHFAFVRWCGSTLRDVEPAWPARAGHSLVARGVSACSRSACRTSARWSSRRRSRRFSRRSCSRHRRSLVDFPSLAVPKIVAPRAVPPLRRTRPRRRPRLFGARAGATQRSQGRGARRSTDGPAVHAELASSDAHAHRAGRPQQLQPPRSRREDAEGKSRCS